MMKTAMSLPDAGYVEEKLIDQYGADKLWQIERLSQHIFRGWMVDGTILLATVCGDGRLIVKEV